MKIETNAQLLIRLLDITEDQYNNLLIDTANEYLDRSMGLDAFGKQVLLSRGHFWQWWIRQWNRREKIFIHTLSLRDHNKLSREERLLVLKAWYEEHSLDNLAVYPNRVVLESTYAVAVGQLIDHEHKSKNV